MQLTAITLWGLAGFSFLFLGGFIYVSVIEGQRRAAAITAAFAIPITGFLALSGFLQGSIQSLVLYFIIGSILLGVILFLLPTHSIDRLRDVPGTRFDERDIMFARHRLQPGTPNYKNYYDMRPENELVDDLFRSQPGLLSPNARYSDPLLFALPNASFTLTEAMHVMVDGEPSSEVIPLPENPIRTQLVKKLALYLGALDVGITMLKPEYIYSHIGRGSGAYGSPIDLDHKVAIAFTVEMDHGIMGKAPQAPVTLETARQYVEAGRVAVQLAQMIRNWGYQARAHMDGDYRIICPLVARDAGLGEIGRMGILMTPRQGPRVRIAVVTTNLELTPDEDVPDASMIEFCTVCGKCAGNCPPKAISFEDRSEIDGAFRWRIDSNLCFRYWNAIGTDCGRCMTVCPYSHPGTFYHNLVRWGNQRSGLFRRSALWMDDFLYGKYPKRANGGIKIPTMD